MRIVRRKVAIKQRIHSGRKLRTHVQDEARGRIFLSFAPVFLGPTLKHGRIAGEKTLFLEVGTNPILSRNQIQSSLILEHWRKESGWS